ncbi:MAG: hypothetical protein QXM54_04000 [Desulfurococcaceae archaeon]
MFSPNDGGVAIRDGMIHVYLEEAPVVPVDVAFNDPVISEQELREKPVLIISKIFKNT